jgi:hypothetical protein
MSVRRAGVILQAILLGVLGYLLLFLLTGYHPDTPSFHPPFLIFVLDTVNLFIHEAGHFFFKIFGQWVHVLAGSFFQVFLPLALFVVTWRQTPQFAAYPGFWVGESLINVSVYIKDAPHRQLRLIARGLIHDWNWLLSDHLDAAEPLGEGVYVLGILMCVASLGWGIYTAVQAFRNPIEVTAPE